MSNTPIPPPPQPAPLQEAPAAYYNVQAVPTPAEPTLPLDTLYVGSSVNVPVEAEQSEASPADSVHNFAKASLMCAKGVSWVLYVYLIATEIILGTAFVLLLFGANPSSGFVEWVYNAMDRSMQPFYGMFPIVEIGTNSADTIAYFSGSILFAMAFYGVLVFLVQALITWVSTKLDKLVK